MEQGEAKSEARFTLPLSARNKPFKMTDSQGEIFAISSLGEAVKTTRLLSKSLLTNECTLKGAEITLQAKRIYKPKTVSSLLNLSNSILGKGEILSDEFKSPGHRMDGCSPKSV